MYVDTSLFRSHGSTDDDVESRSSLLEDDEEKEMKHAIQEEATKMRILRQQKDRIVAEEEFALAQYETAAMKLTAAAELEVGVIDRASVVCMNGLMSTAHRYRVRWLRFVVDEHSLRAKKH